MLAMHRWAVIAACSLPLLLAGCTTAAPDAKAVVAVPTPSPVANAPDTAAAALPDANPVQVGVTGTVLSKSGAPVLGATVSVRPASSVKDCISCASAEARTDADGRFALVLTRGNYLITCAVEGGSTCRVEGDATPGLLTVTSGARDLILVADRAVGSR